MLKKEKAYFHLPGLFEFYELYKVFLPLFYHHREYFYDWCEIGSIYGSPEDCLWGGGRLGEGNQNPYEVLSLMNQYHISSRLTFSNSLLQEKHLQDKRCNDLCALFEKSEVQSGIIIHSDLLLEYLKKKFVEEGKTSAHYHPISRPPEAEAEAVNRIIHLSVIAGNAPVYIVHTSAAKSVDEIVNARALGHKNIFSETCPQYLVLTDKEYDREDGLKFVMSPPLRKQEDSDRLWKAIADGHIQVIATDHCPFQSYEKDWGKDDFTKIPNGCAGIENLYPYMLDAANSGKISFERAVELCSTNPAKIFGCDDKGSIEIGKDADIVIYDKDKDFTISVNNMHSDCDHTIWEGKKLHGYPVQTYLRGSLVYDNGDFVGTPGNGKYVKRSTSK
mgnify:CR=1 FL=1